MADEFKIRSDVSASLHPGLLDRHDLPLKGRAEGALAAAKAAMTALYREQGLVHDARRAVYEKASSPAMLKELSMARSGQGKASSNMILGKNGLELKLPAAEAHAFNEAATLSFRRGASQYDKARATASTELEGLLIALKVKTTDSEARTPQGTAYQAEVRALLRSMNPIDRGTLILAQVKEGNLRVANAVMSADPFMCGLEPDAHKNIVEQIELRFAPQEKEAVNALKQVISVIDTAATLALEDFGKSLVAEPALGTAASNAMSALRTGTGG
jgi:hypothetical protein